MDNRVFNVNGSGRDLLKLTLNLAFSQEGRGEKTAKGWTVDPDKGLILVWYANESDNKFIAPSAPESVVDVVMRWLQTDEAKSIPHEKWDKDCKHDGSNSEGWRVYVEDWGHVGNNPYAICAIKPAFMWHGK